MPRQNQQTQSLEDWRKIYDGLRPEQIDAIDQAIKTRANLTRPLPQFIDTIENGFSKPKY